MVAGPTNDYEESVPPQKKSRIMATQAETNEMAVDVQQPMLSRENQAINNFARTTDEIMVSIIDFYLENLPMLEKMQ